MKNLEQGLVHLYEGDGKGKTTAAVGLAVRSLGQGRRVLFCQFLKGRETGEIAPLRTLGAQVLRAKCCGKFVSAMSGEERAQASADHCDCLAEAQRRSLAGEVDLLVLDEVVDAVNCGMIPLESLLSLLQHRPVTVEVVLTGRRPPPEIEAAADYHTHFAAKKHPYAAGVPARRGIEY